ncbi:MAG: fibronectin type III domain-containing protein [Flavobacteriales bacterium]|nr:fibronectin type III domain-containing protein [Flavobacteriales bacterium]
MGAMMLIGSMLLGSSVRAQVPACGSTNVPAGNLTLSWPDQGPDYYYRVTLAFDPNMINILGQYTTTSTSDVINVQAGYTYGWTVERALIGASNWSGIIGTCSFTTECNSSSNAPTILSGYSGYDCDPSWGYFTAIIPFGDQGVSQFELQLSADPAFPAGSGTITQLSMAFLDTWGSPWMYYSDQMNVSNLQPGTQYHFRVRVIGDCGTGPWATRTFHTRTDPKTMNLKMFLKGPLDASTLLMSDALRTGGLIPNTPLIAPSALSTSGANAIVDWISVDVHDPVEEIPVTSYSWLVQRDGDIVDPATGSAPTVSLPLGNCTFSFQHRNHLPAYVANPINANAGSSVNLDVTQVSTAMYGTQPTATVNGRRALWAGDTNSDGQVKYAGANNDRDVVLSTVGGSVPTAIISGQYLNADLNMDGVVKYAGPNNDRDVILQTIGGSVPTAVRTAQVPH